MTERYCAFCGDAEAVAIIDRSGTPICHFCQDVYMDGQSNPDGTFTDIEDDEDDGEEE